MILLAALHGGNRYVGPYAICSMKYTIFCIVSFCHLANLKLWTVYPMTGIKLNYHKSSFNLPLWNKPPPSNKVPPLFSGEEN